MSDKKLPEWYENEDGRKFRASPVLHRLAGKMKLRPTSAPPKPKKEKKAAPAAEAKPAEPAAK